MTDKHTPGPWSVGTGLAYNVCSELPDTEPQSIVCENIDSYGDACLIAAAPELLKVVEGLLDSGRGSDEIAHALDIPIDRIWWARAAIKAAKGDA